MIRRTKKDLAQDVYLKAFQKLGTFKFQAKLSTWIGHIAYNACCNHLEKKKLVLVNHGDQPEVADEDSTEDPIFNSELSQILKVEIDKLPPLYKTLITLFHTEALSYAEIGQITDLPDGTVKNYLFRARKTLKANLLKHYKREEL